MKCDKFKQLTERFLSDELSSFEFDEMLEHIEQCEICRQEYLAAKMYKTITDNLKNVKPKLESKREFIDGVLGKIPDYNTNRESAKIVKHWFTGSVFRRTIASAAAALILFFVVQQTHDAWLVKQLETKIATKQHAVDYDKIREQSILKMLLSSQEKHVTPILPVQRKIMMLKSKLNINEHKNGFSYVRLSKSIFD